jgi:hypothetical protein
MEGADDVTVDSTADWMGEGLPEAFRSFLSALTGPLTLAGTSRTACDFGALLSDWLSTMSGATALISPDGAPELARTSTTWARRPFPMIRQAPANTSKKAASGFRCSAVIMEFPRWASVTKRVTSGRKQ